MHGPRGAAVIGQSGGPTAVINESLVGAALEARKYPNIERFLGARHGVKGILAEDFVDLGAEARHTLEAVARTPSAGLGSVRKKPTADECKAMFEIFRRHNVRYYFYIGGNDSAETANIVHEVARANDFDLRVIHIPKTIDNDLVGHDHCPGFGSAARFVALAFMGDNLDNRSLPGIKINVVMGRHAGFLTAAAALARQYDDDAPHLLYLPERALSMDQFCNDVKTIHERLGRCVVAVSEGIHDDSGTLFAEKFITEVDSHGNKQLSGTGALGDYLAGELKARLGAKLRVRADTLGYLQRCFAGTRSEVDASEARRCGEWGVAQAAIGNHNGSVAMVRRADTTYDVDLVLRPLTDVAQKTRHVPDDWINSFGNDVTADFLAYARPLVGELPRMGRLAMVPATANS